MSYWRRDLCLDHKQGLPAPIEDYSQELVPRHVRLTLSPHHLRQHRAPEWVWQQVYRDPYPKELMLRNHG
jgi:uncharacterized protein YbgA (DUF1722 family)